MNNLKDKLTGTAHKLKTRQHKRARRIARRSEPERAPTWPSTCVMKHRGDALRAPTYGVDELQARAPSQKTQDDPRPTATS
eukprot:6224194-Prymnesium_polylepis.1